MRLIDADELKKKFNERSYWTYTHEYGDAIPIGRIMSGIDNAPTVIVMDLCSKAPLYCGECRRERPQGKWIVENDVYCKCPFCGFKDVKYSNYCPDCGAKMERREE